MTANPFAYALDEIDAYLKDRPDVPEDVRRLTRDLHELNTLLAGSGSREALAHNVAAELVGRGYLHTEPTEARVDAVARELGKPDYEGQHYMVKFNLREQARQVLAALARIRP